MSDQSTLRLSLPLIAAGQAQKHVTHNEGMILLDAQVHMHLIGLGAVTPPVGALEGDAFALGLLPTGAWAGQGGKVALFRDMTWLFLMPLRGWRATVGVNAVLHVHDGTSWIAATQQELRVSGRLGVGALADANNPITLRTNNMLIDADPAAGPDTGDVRLKLNRTSAGDICSVLFQSGYSGRAEFGLTASDAIECRVSASGTGFATALAISPDDAIVRLPTRPVFKARRAGADLVISTVGSVIGWNQAVVNVSGGFDVANSRFVVPVTGVYAFTAMLFAEVAATRTIVDLVRNGTQPIGRGELANVGGPFDHIMVSTVEALQKNDTIDMRLAFGTVRITGQHFTSFCGHLIG